MKTITLLNIEVPIREVAVEPPERPFIMVAGRCSVDHRPIYPLWLQAIQLPDADGNKQESQLLTRMLLNTMVWNKPVSSHQRLDNYRELPGARANMIGLYEQMFAERKPAGVFADIPPGDDGEVYLIRSGHLYSVFADSVGAAKNFCLHAMDVTHHRQSMEQEGLAEAHRSTIERLQSIK